MADSPLTRPPQSSYLKLCIAGLVAWLIVSAMIVKGDSHAVTDAYAHGSLAWINGQNMYDTTGQGFLYLPQAALLYAPFAAAPEPAGDVLWRLACLAIFLLGVARFATLQTGDPARVLLHVSIVSLAMCANGLRLGQSTLPMTGCMLLAVESLSRRAWNGAAWWLLLGLAVKPLTIVLMLLAAALHAPMRLRLLGGCLLLAALPFCAQHPSYVVWQYAQFGDMLRHANDLGNQAWWAQLFGMLKTFGQPVSPEVQTASRVAAALATLGLCWLIQRRCAWRQSHIWLYTLTAVYLMLFNPRTENSTYCVLGPALGMFYAEQMLAGRRGTAALLLSLMVCCVGSYELGKHFTPPDAKTVWLAPLACCCFVAYLLPLAVHDLIGERPRPVGQVCRRTGSSSLT